MCRGSTWWETKNQRIGALEYSTLRYYQKEKDSMYLCLIKVLWRNHKTWLPVNEAIDCPSLLHPCNCWQPTCKAHFDLMHMHLVNIIVIDHVGVLEQAVIGLSTYLDTQISFMSTRPKLWPFSTIKVTLTLSLSTWPILVWLRDWLIALGSSMLWLTHCMLYIWHYIEYDHPVKVC